MNNFDKVRSMTDSEMIEFLSGFSVDAIKDDFCKRCVNQKGFFCEKEPYECKYTNDEVELLRMWGIENA